MRSILSAFSVALVGSSILVVAQAPPAGQPPAGQPAPPPQPMSFFVTSVGLGNGANLGGIAGADRHCQTLAAAAGRRQQDLAGVPERRRQPADSPRSTRAIASEPGPWYNAKNARIAQNVGDLHGDTLEQARRGNNLTKVTALNEKGEPVNGVGDTPNRHDIITGSQLDGTAFTDGADHTCGNYTSGAAGTVQLGHHDRMGGGSTSWNSTHASRGCSQENLVATGGAGLLYCFATN